LVLISLHKPSVRLSDEVESVQLLVKGVEDRADDHYTGFEEEAEA
jgi:hypothetical protein